MPQPTVFNYRRREPGESAVWRLPQWAEDRFQELVHELGNHSPESNEYESILDEIRSLPGFPVRASEATYIRRVVTTTRH